MSLSKIIASSKYSLPHDPTASFEGRTVLVTGSNTGLGLQVAKKYAALGARKIILGVRNTKKGERAKHEVVGSAPGTIDVEVWQVDLESYDSIKAFAQRIDTDLENETLDIAVMNAGVTFMTSHTSAEGWDQQIQINYLSTLLLAILLLPKLRASKTKAWTPVLTFTSSGRHMAVPASRFDLPQAALDSKTPFLSYWSQPTVWPSGQDMYDISKLLVEFAIGMIASNPIAQDPSTKEIYVIVNSSCPGICRTDLGRDYIESSILMRCAAYLFFKVLSRTAEQGSRSIVSATTLGEQGHGQFWQNDVIVKHNRGLISSPEGKALQAKIWEETMTVLTKAAPQVRDILGQDFTRGR